MKLSFLRASLPSIACAAAFCATGVWNTKDSSIWTNAEANLILNNSPWAKPVKTKPAGGGGGAQRRGGGRMGRRGGMGGGRGGASAAPLDVVVRWESAKPIQEAEARLRNLNASAGSKSGSDPAGFSEKYYVVSVIGLRLTGRQGGRNQDDGESGGDRQVRDQLLTTTQLIRKNKVPLGPDDVKVKTQGGENEIEFFFAKTSPISLDDNEVTFRTTAGRMQVESKFELKKMTRNKKLELD